MKVFISADIEGITTTSQWDDCTLSHPMYKQHALQMTKEVQAACEGAIAAGATDIFIKDAHGGAVNIDQSMMPECVRVHRKWSGHPYSMVDGIDGSFDALMFIGYHSACTQKGNPLSHTMNDDSLFCIKINDCIASEFTMHSLAGAYESVPTVFLSGDLAICEYSKAMTPKHPNLITVAVKEGNGYATINNSPSLMVKTIREQSEISLKQDLKKSLLELPKSFKVEIQYAHHGRAYRASFFPGVKQVSDTEVLFENNDYFEVLRCLKFIL